MNMREPVSNHFKQLKVGQFSERVPEKAVRCPKLVNRGGTRSIAVTFCIPAALPRPYYPTSSITVLYLLFAGAAFRTRDFWPECSWLEDSTGFG